MPPPYLAMAAAFAAAALLLFVYLACRAGRRDGFTARAQEVCDVSRDLFAASGGATTYSQFKTALPGVDPVTFTDVRRLWTEGRLSPEAVQSAL